MKKLLIFFVCLFLLVSCEKDKAASQKKQGKKRQIAVEVYIAEKTKSARAYETMASLEPYNQVSLAAATSGRLVQFKAKDGAFVSKNTLIAKIDDAELQAELKKANSSLALAEQNLNRTKTLHEKDGATAEDLEVATANFNSAKAQVELIKAQIEKTEIRAPFAGRLGFSSITVGAWLSTGAPIITLTEVNRLKVKFALPQRYAKSAKIGDEITIKSEDGFTVKQGKVKALEATLSEASRTRQVLVELENKKEDFVPGSYAKALVPLNEKAEAAISVPAEALTLDKDGAYVFVLKEGKATVKHVKTSLRTPISVDIIEGLDEGDSVIVSGLMSMRPGVDVRVKEVRRAMKYEVNP